MAVAALPAGRVESLSTLPPASRTLKPLGQRLLDAGLITAPQLHLALREKDRTGQYLGAVLVNLGFITDDILTRSLATETHTQVVDLAHLVVEDQVIERIPYDTAKRFRVLPLGIQGSTLTVAMADAFDVVAIDALERLTGLQLEITSAPEADIFDAIERHYAHSSSIDDTIDRLMRGNPAQHEDVTGGEAPMIRLADQIITLAIKLHSTDIHIEPEEKVLRVRTRVDGVLRQELLIPIQLRDGLTARLKLMANMNITERRIPQDGRLRFNYGRREIDLRVATLPTQYGESVVLRILEAADTRPAFRDLGIHPEAMQQLQEVISRPFGLLLVTGPTGSGKTSTMYSALGEIDAVQRSIFTVEDPIEYAVPLVRQTQVRNDIGMTFAAGLRALLRQDPDVILIGEMRDLETAQLGFRAALTGHLVFSTLHTNDAIGVIPRLADMGVDRYLIPAGLSGVVAQRLIRKLCPHCAAPDPAAASWRTRFPEVLGNADNLLLGKGCDACRRSGYKGRQAIFEVLVIDHDFHDPIMTATNTSELTRLALRKGMRTMLVDGLSKAAAGTTSVQEVLRVVR